MTEACHAKINLFLHVNGKRPDGYHHLQTWVAFTDLADTVTLREAKASFFLALGPFAQALPPVQNNLVIKAIQFMAQRHKKTQAHFHVELTKNLPIGAGLGGGSANVGGALRALQKIWDFEWYEDDALWLAEKLGADVPVCLAERSCIVTGIGERLKPTQPLPPDIHIVVIFPGVSITTQQVFSMISPPYTPPLTSLQTRCGDAVDLVQILRETRNDLMQSAISQERAILKAYRTIVQQPGCLLPRMSGSGSSCFGIFADAETAKSAARAIAAAEPTWWVRPTRLLSAPPSASA